MTDSLQGVVGLELSDAAMELNTPKKIEDPHQTTPRRSERKRALFPSLSPQTSDLGHMSPLGSSPDRFSSAPATPDSGSFDPVKITSKSVSPFGRRAGLSKGLCAVSPRKRFSELFGPSMKDSIVPLAAKTSAVHNNHVLKSKDIVPIDQLEQTLLSVMDEDDCDELPQSHHTPRSALQSHSTQRAKSDLKSSQPLTPSKRRSMPAGSSQSTASTSPCSPEQLPRHSLESRSKSDQLPKARTSLFSGSNGTSRLKRVRNDGIYLTGRVGAKRGRMLGEINGGVRTGIRPPPKAKTKPMAKESTKKKQQKVKSIWDVVPKSTARKRSTTAIKVPKMSLLATRVEDTDEDFESFSASGSLQMQSKRSRRSIESGADEMEEEDDPEPDQSKRFFKVKARKFSYTLENYRMGLNKGKKVDKAKAPPVKRMRKLYNPKENNETLKDFEDNHEDVADSTRGDVQNILQKLEEDKSDAAAEPSPIQPLDAATAMSEPGQPPHGSASSSDITTFSAAPNSPPRPVGSLSFLSPLSQLATSTSTLSINVGGDTLRLNKAQVQALTEVPDVIMEDDDDLPPCEDGVINASVESSNVPMAKETCESGASPADETKENGSCETNALQAPTLKYFPIFSGQPSTKIEASAEAEPKRKRSLLRPIGNDQYQLDAGQKRFGPTECGECGAVYQMGEPEDEIAHTEYHNAVRELNHVGWKQERLVGLYGKDRVVLIRPGDPKPWWCKALKVLQVVDKDLGFAEGVPCEPNRSMVYLYVSDNQIMGFLMAIPIKKAYKMLMTAADIGDIDCCSAEEYPVKCGVSRIWVHKSKRRRNIATYLMDCMRKNFMFGHVLSLEEFAFSTPTAMGKIFAEHYVGRKDYFVFQ